MAIISIPILQERSKTETPDEKKLVSKISWRIVPILGLLYGLIFLNRNNIGLSAPLAVVDPGSEFFGTNNVRDPKFRKNLSLLGIIFHAGYGPIEFVTNAFLLHFEPKIWLFVIMGMSGTLGAVSGAVNDIRSLQVIRFFLGLFEGAFFPGAIYMMSRWYRRDYLGFPVAVFYSGAGVLAALGGLLAAAIFTINNEKREKWQWVSIIEGSLTLILMLSAIWLPNPVEIGDHAIQPHSSSSDSLETHKERDSMGNTIGLPTVTHQTVVYSTDRNHDHEAVGPTKRSRFFNADEKLTFDNWMTRDGDKWRAVPEHLRSEGLKYWKRAVCDWKLPIFIVMRITSVLPRDLMVSFLPKIIENMRSEYQWESRPSEMILLTVPPLILALFFNMLIGWISDVTRMRGWTNIACSLLTVVGGIILLAAPSSAVQYFAACIVCLGSFSTAANAQTWVCNNIEGYSKRAIVLGIATGSVNTTAILTPGTSIYDEKVQFALILGLSGISVLVSFGLHWYLKNENLKKIYSRQHGYDAWDPTSGLPEKKGDLSPEFLYFE